MSSYELELLRGRKRPSGWCSHPAASELKPRRQWRIFASARGRILGWSVALLAAATATSTVATHAFLVASMNNRISTELHHEIGEFRALAAKNGAVGSPGNGTRDDKAHGIG